MRELGSRARQVKRRQWQSLRRPHHMRVGASQGFACEVGCFACVNLIAARCYEEIKLSAVCTCENDRFGDLIQIAACGISSLLGGARVGGHFDRDCPKACGGQCVHDAVKALAHVVSLLV